MQQITKTAWNYYQREKLAMLITQYITNTQEKPQSYTCKNCGLEYNIKKSFKRKKCFCPGCNTKLKKADVFSQCFPGHTINDLLNVLGYQIKDNNKKQIGVIVTNDIAEKLQALALKQNTTVTNIVVKILEREIDSMSN